MMRKLLFGGIFFCVIAIVVFVSRATVFAAATDSVSGWLWGGSDDGAGNATGLGWVSTNNLDCNGTNCPVGAVSYGVNIPSSDGDVTGYGWSENVGWIDFNPQTHCGSAYTALSCASPLGNAGVRRSGNTLVGWARIVGIATESAVNNSGGWSGWVSMSQSTGGGAIPYGVSINNDGTLSGYGWNGENAAPIDGLGYIDFSRAKIQGTNQLIVCPSPAGGIGMAAGSTISVRAFYFPNYAGTANCTQSGFGTNVSVDPGTNWTSDVPAVATVAKNVSAQRADVTGVSGGSSSIGATYNGLSAAVTVNVTSVPGACGNPGSCLSAIDASTPGLCTSGVVHLQPSSGSSWNWDCDGVGGGTTEHCSKAKCSGHFIEVAP